MFNRAAARPKCSSSATATKQRTWLSSNIPLPLFSTVSMDSVWLAYRIPRFDPKLVSDHPHSSSLLDRSSLILPPARPKTAMRDATERLRNFDWEEEQCFHVSGAAPSLPPPQPSCSANCPAPPTPKISSGRYASSCRSRPAEPPIFWRG